MTSNWKAFFFEENGPMTWFSWIFDTGVLVCMLIGVMLVENWCLELRRLQEGEGVSEGVREEVEGDGQKEKVEKGKEEVKEEVKEVKLKKKVSSEVPKFKKRTSLYDKPTKSSLRKMKN